MTTMTGAEAIIGTLADCGVEACFANPGTSEMHLVTALDREPRIRSVLCLFEGVATGAADGYARMAGKPALTLLHLGPGYLNAGANIHNGRRAYVPMVNLIGDHAVTHRQYDAPLASDIAALAAPNSRWLKSVDRLEDAGTLAAEAYAASFGPPAGPVSLIMPADIAWTPGATRASPAAHAGLAIAGEDVIEQAGRAITKAKVSAAITERAHATHTARTQADFQAVEVEAVSNALLIAEHERFGTKARVLFENVLDVIADQISNMPMLEKLVALVESADGEANTSLRKATSLPMMVDAAKKAIEGGTKAADMERKARNLDDAPGPEATYEDRLRRLAESMPEV